MSFISWQYPFLLIGAAGLYWLMPRRLRVFVLLIVSYIFYGAWDARFLALLLTTTTVDYFSALAIEGNRRPLWQISITAMLPLGWLIVCKSFGVSVPSPALLSAAMLVPFLQLAHILLWKFPAGFRRKAFLTLSLCSNLTILGFFKYFNFFADSLSRGLAIVHIQTHWTLTHILLPIGISFYTFQSLAYLMDVYRRQNSAFKSYPTFAAYLAFFPQLLAGPIGRSPQLMPQWLQPRVFSFSLLHDGARLILIGLFKKVFVADNCALLANTCFDSQKSLGGAWSLLGVLAFAFQIYGDFSGYTDIARGSAKWLGFDLMINFRFPYFARTPSEFWQRWHISLSSWFRDYLYIPLGGNRGATTRTLFNLMLTMLLAGLWHGAGGMFMLWGLYYGALLVIYRITPALDMPDQQSLGKRIAATSLMFPLTLFGWAIFRSANCHALTQWMLSLGQWTSPIPWKGPALWLCVHVAPLLGLQWLTRKNEDESELTHLPWLARGLIYALLILLIVSSSNQDQEFIYFQF